MAAYREPPPINSDLFMAGFAPGTLEVIQAPVYHEDGGYWHMAFRYTPETADRLQRVVAAQGSDLGE